MPKKAIIVLLGDGSVGKSCMITRFVNNEFLEYYDPTIQDTFRKTVTIDGEPSVVEILDTAGQEEYSSLNEAFIMKGDGFLFVYSVTKSDSLEKLDLIIQNVFSLREMTVAEPKVGIVVCGNKCDKEDERKITKSEGVQLAEKYNADFFETSAKSSINIDQAFETLIRNSLSFVPDKVEEPVKKSKRCTIL